MTRMINTRRTYSTNHQLFYTTTQSQKSNVKPEKKSLDWCMKNITTYT